MNTKLKEAAEKYTKERYGSDIDLFAEKYPFIGNITGNCKVDFMAGATSEAARLYWKEQFKLEQEANNKNIIEALEQMHNQPIQIIHLADDEIIEFENWKRKNKWMYSARSDGTYFKGGKYLTIKELILKYRDSNK